MILFFDSLLDTRAKRYHALMLITMITCILLIIPYIILSIYLISLQSYNSLFDLLKEPILQYTYISRVILDGISLVSFSVGNVLPLFFYNIRWYECFCILFICLCFPVIDKKKSTTYMLLLVIVEVIAIMILVYFGTRAHSLSIAIRYIHGIGYIVGIINLVLCGILFRHVIKHIRAYRIALQYEVEEIKEHTDN